MIIKSIAETSYSGMYKVAPTEGPAFFIRKEYLPGIDFDAIDVGSEQLVSKIKKTTYSITIINMLIKAYLFSR